VRLGLLISLQAYTDGVNHYINTSKALPLEFYIFGNSGVKWDINNSCLIGKLVEYYLTMDFYQETLRTYLRDVINLPVHIIEKIFPYHSSLLEYNTYIIKPDEMKKIRKKKTQLTEDDVKYINVTKTTAPDNEGISNSIKNDMSLNLEELSKQNKVGSNSCVISGKHTKNGFPYICNDPHLQNSNPAFWYLVNIKIANEYHLIGATPPGLPFIFVGSNSHVAWGMTNGMVDTTDIIRVERSGDDYILDGKKYQFSKRVERIYTNPKKTEYIDQEYLFSEWGPVINQYADSLYFILGRLPVSDLLETDKYYYILRSTYTDKSDTTSKALVKLNKVKDIKSLRNAVKLINIPLSIVYADVRNRVFNI
jgi:acyl-homoserine lactone acylase PvdQ